ncbi:MAG: FAD-dependent oxidoreductase [Alphaproteobacteria bacterium]|nr:FAD-dependent oxidoreductase [Alphaproteobacteria bacterium]
MSRIPTQARAVIVGGGIVGCSVAYHLARLGWKDVILLERHKLTSGSTFHAAGLVGQLRSNANVTRLLTHSVELYKRLEAETGQATGWKMSGCLRLACTPERLIELKRLATTARSFGLEMQIIGRDEALKLWPVMNAADVIGAAFAPTDGQANPSDITQALAKGARMGGAKIVEDCAVTGFAVENGRIVAVETAEGRIACEVAVNCAGQWAREIGALAGVNVPLVSVQHQYLITEPIPGMPRNLPTVRDPDRLTYYKEEVGGLVMGGYEPNPIPWANDGIPKGFHFTLLDSDWDHFQPMMEAALARVPALEKAGIRTLVNGPESFTPDGNFILGEAPEVAGFFVGAGFNAFGIASAGGAGKALAEWVAGGAPPMDLWPVDVRRFGSPHRDIEWVRARTLELYGKHYTVAWPAEEHHSVRPRFASPLYGRLKAADAVFGEKMGWERANWFAPAGAAPEDRYSFTAPNWTDAVAAEHHAAREAAALFDQTSFAKFVLEGRDAEKALSWIAAGNVARPAGAVTYTQMLNAKGGIEADLTVVRLSPESYYIVTGTGFRTRDFDWIRRNIPAGLDARLSDVTDDFSTLALMGPKSRAILAAVNDADMANAAFPFMTWQDLPIAGVKARGLRVTYVGELGWELHIPKAHAERIFDALIAVGKSHGLKLAGYRAIETLRLEKGYRAWGADINPDSNPFEAGLGWAVKLKSGVPFQGREALAAARGKPLKKRLACFAVDNPNITLWGRESILRDGKVVGWLSSAGFGHTVGHSIGYGYVRNEVGVDDTFLGSGIYELEVACERVPCRWLARPPYDPDGARVRG